MDVKKYVKLTLRLVLTAGLLAIYIYIGHILEYWSQLSAVDNITGAAPLILLTGIIAFLTALIWKRHKNAETSTMVLLVMGVIWALLFIPALTGNWYPLAKIPAPDLTSPDLSVYAPFSQDTQAARLPGEATLTITEDLPVLDGATALYPVYAAFVNAVYDEASYTPDLTLCSNTPNAYKRIIAGDCDIIFVAGASEKQQQAAAAVGSNLVFTPIGREAFVFLIGKANPVDGLSYQQLKNIYSGKTAYWHTLGWRGGGKLIAFQRPEGSGSQTGLQNIMRGLPIQKPQPLPDDSLIGTGSMMKQVSVEWKGVQPAIGYSYRYYATTMYANPDVKMLAIDGVYPSNETISNESYPFTANFYAVTNGEPTGNTKQLIDWILTDEGQYLIEQTGYVPLKIREDAVDISSVHDENETLKRILADNVISDKERHQIDIEYEKEMSNPEVWTTAEMTDTTIKCGDMWKAEMEKYLDLLMEELNDDKKKWVSQSQEKWEISTKDNEELSWQVYDQMHHGGSIMSNLAASIYYEKYRTRALYLKSLYDYLTVDR